MRNHWRGSSLEGMERLAYSKGIVAYTVTRPAMAPIPKVTPVGKASPGRVLPWTKDYWEIRQAANEYKLLDAQTE